MQYTHSMQSNLSSAPLTTGYLHKVNATFDTVHRRVLNPFSNLLSLTSPRGGQRWLQGVLRPRLLALQPCVLFDEDPLHKWLKVTLVILMLRYFRTYEVLDVRWSLVIYDVAGEGIALT